jgi:hypothetical protein
VLAEWETLPDGTRQPKLAVPLPAGASAMDVCAQPAASIPTNPNALVVEVWADTVYLDSLPAGEVLWREPYGTT